MKAAVGSITAAANAAHLWRDAGLSEHASIASFSRFLLHLLSVGAPPDLLRQAVRALDDELTHTLLCFRVAQTIDGGRMGPGPLAVEQGLGDDSPEAILESAIREGCVAETVSAVLAGMAAEDAIHPPAVKALRRIQIDEDNHAKLAWEFVEWLLGRFPELRETARACFAEELDLAVEELEDDELDAGIGAFGQISPSTRARRARAVVETNVRPRMEALFDRLERRQRTAS